MLMAKQSRSIRRTIFGDHEKGVDRVLIFRFFRLLHGRFWGLGGLISMMLGAAIGYAIRPDLLRPDIALSELGTDIRTAPFFAGSMFFAAYSLWRWRTYLRRTFKTDRPVVPLISLTILGLYLIALMPVTWEVWPHRLHNLGVMITGLSMAATVLLDSVLSRTKYKKHKILFRLIKSVSLLLIIFGGVVVLLSVEEVAVLSMVLIGEAMMFAGYAVWVILRIYLGEGRQSAIGRIMKKIFG